MPLNITNSLTIGKYAKKAVTGVSWVAVGEGSIIANSTDGNEWNAVPVASRGVFSIGWRVAYGTDGAGNGRWVAVGDGGGIA